MKTFDANDFFIYLIVCFLHLHLLLLVIF